MDRSSPLDVTIIDKDESSEQAYHVVDGFVIEDSKSPFPVSGMVYVLLFSPRQTWSSLITHSLCATAPQMKCAWPGLTRLVDHLI